MINIREDLPSELDRLHIHVFADLHIGDRQCDFELIKARLEEVKRDKSAYIILNGDILNNATKTSISDSYGETAPPMEQIQRAVDLFSPVRGKILAITTGNHERRTYNKEGIDLMEVFARQMGLHDRFSPASALLWVSFGRLTHRNKEGRKITYSVFMNHGSGGGRREGGKINRLADMASIIDADVYIHSHTHLPVILKNDYYRTFSSNRTSCRVTRLFVNTSAQLDYGGYGEAQEYKPSSKDTPVIILDGHKRYCTATL